MSRIKRKRILAGIAVLLLLLLFAGVVLRKPDEPKIVGKFSKGDVLAISKIVLDLDRAALKFDLKNAIRHGQIRSFSREVSEYLHTRIVSIEECTNSASLALTTFGLTNGEALVTFGPEHNSWSGSIVLERKTNGWQITPAERQIIAEHFIQPTNAAPVSQSVVAK